MIKKLREFLSDNNLDYLLVNTTDEFLVEYNELSNNSRHLVTGFSGSTGDALVSKESVWQFVDGRYHEQADEEVDKKAVTVVKLALGQTFSEELANKIKPNSKIGVVSKKISLSFYKILKYKLQKKHTKIVSLDFDPITQFQKAKPDTNNESAQQVDISITGTSADEKFKILTKKIPKDCVYFDTNLENIAWLTNFRQYKTPFSSTFKAKAVVSKQKVLIYTDEKVEGEIGKHFEILPLYALDKAFKNIETVFYNSGTINYYDFKLIKSKAQESPKDMIKELKSIKNPAEINHFKSCFERTDKVVNAAFKKLQNKALGDPLSEADLSNFVESQFKAQGAKQLSFSTILAAGKNSSIIHYSNPSEKVEINDGDFVLLDCGGHFEGGYSTDITRTFVKGEPSDLQKRVYTTVLKMFLNAYNYKVTNRTTGFTLDKIARKIHAKSGLKDFNFNHGLGHGVGISVHENPPTISFSASGKSVLKENMVFTIEPGLYKTGFGGVRLENTVYLTKQNGQLKIESFSHVPFQESAIDEKLLSEQEKLWLRNWQAKC